MPRPGKEELRAANARLRAENEGWVGERRRLLQEVGKLGAELRQSQHDVDAARRELFTEKLRAKRAIQDLETTHMQLRQTRECMSRLHDDLARARGLPPPLRDLNREARERERLASAAEAAGLDLGTLSPQGVPLEYSGLVAGSALIGGIGQANGGTPGSLLGASGGAGGGRRIAREHDGEGEERGHDDGAAAGISKRAGAAIQAGAHPGIGAGRSSPHLGGVPVPHLASPRSPVRSPGRNARSPPLSSRAYLGSRSGSSQHVVSLVGLDGADRRDGRQEARPEGRPEAARGIEFSQLKHEVSRCQRPHARKPEITHTE